ncbi:MAG: PAS domain-containing protein, partial [Gallionellaceae bacterium]
MVKNKFAILTIGAVQLAVLLSAIGIVLLATWWAVLRIEAGHQSAQAKSFTSVLKSESQALSRWSKQNKKIAKRWADMPAIRAKVKELLALPRQQEVLLGAPAQRALREQFYPLIKTDIYRGFFIVDRDAVTLASSRDVNVGSPNLLRQQANILKKLWAGHAAVSVPMKSDVPLRDLNGHMRDDYLTQFIGAPVHAEDGQVLAILLLRLNPVEELFPMLKLGRKEDTGETYIFDQSGYLLSESRFTEQLDQLGLSPDSGQTIQLVDPGMDMTQAENEALFALSGEYHPLTQMAASATRGESGMNLDGYRNYRGIMVVGAWLWHQDLGVGIAVEQDIEEVERTLNETKFAIYSGAALSIFLLLVLAYVDSRRRRSQLESEAELKRAKETAEDVSRFLNTVTDALPGMVGYWNKALRCGFANAAYLSWFGRSHEQMIDISTQDLMGDELFHKNEPYIRAALRGEPQRFERTLVKADGSTGYTWA